MKILVINWQDPQNPRAGGAEIHLHEIFRRIRQLGHEVTWLASGWKGSDRRAQLDGIEVHRCGSRYTFGARVVPYFRRNLADRSFDIAVEALNKVPVYSPLWCTSPVVLLVHHLFGTAAFKEASPPVAAMTWLQERPLRLVYRETPVQTISHSTAADLLARGLVAEHIEVIHPGVDHGFFSRASSPTRSPVPTFLYLGRLQRYKQVDLILRAFARVRNQMDSARVVIAGRGANEGSLRNLCQALGIADHVFFAGYVTEKRKRELFRSSWANVFVSPKEGWGITNLEAAACGTPTIASDSAGLRESVVNGQTGFLVPHGDVASLALTMRRIAADPQLVEMLGAGAVEFARGFSWERSAHATLDHLARTAGCA
ncbi:MAG: glycosyltransferase [Gemmatimonas sp.]|nr:glycosyltransferase [Gemmatimonas sp.]